MSGFKGSPNRVASTPMTGILAFLVGLGALALYFKKYTFPSPTLTALQFALGAVLLVRGIWVVVFSKRSAREVTRWNRWTPYRAHFTREGLVYLAIMMTVFVGALMGRSNLLMLVFGLLAGPFVVNGYVTLTMLQKNRVRRQVQERVMLGEPFWVEIELLNGRRWLSSWMMVVYDTLQNAQESLQPSVLFARVSPGARHSQSYQATLQQRGRYEFGPLRLSTRFPLGLVDRSLMLDVRNEILVHPRIGSLSPRWRRDDPAADELVQHAKSRQGTCDDEFHRLREYRSGDNPRAIHWRTSARRNALIVREYHQNRDLDLAILLDLWCPPLPSAAVLERVESAISFAATLCVDYGRDNRESTLFLGISGAELVCCVVPAGPLNINSLLDQLALAQPHPTQDLSRLATEPFLLRNPRLRSVLLTTRKLTGGTAPGLEKIQAQLLHNGIRPRTIEADFATLSQFCVWDPAREAL